MQTEEQIKEKMNKPTSGRVHTKCSLSLARENLVHDVFFDFGSTAGPIENNSVAVILLIAIKILSNLIFGRYNLLQYPIKIHIISCLDMETQMD